nr:MAG TPA: hypothetical protein [Bacteriophage sp.]
MAVLRKAILIGYDKLSQMIESNSIDEDAVYFLSGKDVVNAIKNIQVPTIDGNKLVATDITKAPDFAGQVAISYGQIYIAESTEGPGAWRIVLLQPNDHL